MLVQRRNRRGGGEGKARKGRGVLPGAGTRAPLAEPAAKRFCRWKELTRGGGPVAIGRRREECVCVWIWEGGDRHIRLDGNGKDKEKHRETQPRGQTDRAQGPGETRPREKTV